MLYISKVQCSPLTNCFGFVDGTIRQICRPGKLQRVVYNGHERVHALKFQSVALPNGLTANLYSPVEGCRHDAGMLKDSGLLSGLLAYLNSMLIILLAKSFVCMETQHIAIDK